MDEGGGGLSKAYPSRSPPQITSRPPEVGVTVGVTVGVCVIVGVFVGVAEGGGGGHRSP